MPVIKLINEAGNLILMQVVNVESTDKVLFQDFLDKSQSPFGSLRKESNL